METASEKIIINFLNSDDVTEANKCVADLSSDSRLSAIVRNAVDAALKGISIPQECTGLLHYNLHVAGMQHTLRDLQETLKGLRVYSGRRICNMAVPGRDDHPHDWGKHPHGRAVWPHEGPCNMFDHWCLGGKLCTLYWVSVPIHEETWPREPPQLTLTLYIQIKLLFPPSYPLLHFFVCPPHTLTEADV